MTFSFNIYRKMLASDDDDDDDVHDSSSTEHRGRMDSTFT
jgi:hypothetical protein